MHLDGPGSVESAGSGQWLGVREEDWKLRGHTRMEGCSWLGFRALMRPKGARQVQVTQSRRCTRLCEESAEWEIIKLSHQGFRGHDGIELMSKPLDLQNSKLILCSQETMRKQLPEIKENQNVFLTEAKCVCTCACVRIANMEREPSR